MRLITSFLATLLCVLVCAQTQTHIAGKMVNIEPFMLFHNTYNHGQPIFASINPSVLSLDGETLDCYITADKSEAEWNDDITLIDVRSSGAQTVSFSGSSIQELQVLLANTNELSGIEEARPGVHYDIVFDRNQNGVLDDGDYIDGLAKAGMTIVSDMFEPGPYGVDSLDYVSPTGEWQEFRVYYPGNIESLDAQPLLVISHGWTHWYTYYDHIGKHMASYGYIVMSHANDVGNGGAAASTTASTSALNNIDTLLTNYPDLGGGILDGKIDINRIVHSGHSTGGECVVRAYNRLYTGDYVSPHITHENIVCVNSLAPVAFLSPEQTHPQGSNYHQFLAAADTDVSGAAVNGYVQALSIYERGYGEKQVTYIHGAGHGDLHNYDGLPWVSGPDLIGKEGTHSVLLPYFVALCELYTRNNGGMKEYFTRNRNEFRPPNIADNIVVSGEHKVAEAVEQFVIDDFQTNTEIGLSSSGGVVSSSLENHFEVLMRDFDGSFVWSGTQWSNGMCRSRYTDDPNCAVLSWEDNAQLSYDIPEAGQDWSAHEFFNFRACQITRHPFNVELEGKNFTVEVTDGSGTSSALNTEVYGNISPPYQRTQGGSSDNGIVEVCLPPGDYDIDIGGGPYPEEISFDIPGYVAGEAGTYLLQITDGDPCTDIEILMYDSWGDGWNGGSIVITNSEDEVVVNETLTDGFGPIEPGAGWQNEFYNIQMRTTDFLSGGSDLDLSNIVSLKFLFGPNYGSDMGALGIDDIGLISESAEISVAIDDTKNSSLGVEIYPNPCIDYTEISIASFTKKDNWTYEIRDVKGQLIVPTTLIQNERTILDTDTLNTGIYAVTISSGDVITARTIVKRH